MGATSQSAAAQEGQQHVVDMTDDLVFAPDQITIAPGDTVVWENVGSVGHSVTAYESEIPEEAPFFASGDFEAEEPARSGYPEQGDIPGGEAYEHTFETEGTFNYFCIPHETVGMLGAVEVVPGGAQTEAPVGPAVPETAKTLVAVTTGGLVTVLTLMYFFLKFGGDPSKTEPK